MQKGYIFRLHGGWHLRYRAGGKQVCERLAPFNDQFRTVKSVRGLADEILQPINEGREATGPQTLQSFVENTYLPYAKTHKRPSTYHGYSKLYRAHVAARVAGMRLGSFRTVDAQRLLDGIAGDTNLSHRSLTHIKTLLSAVFAFAKRMGAVDANPIVGTEIPKGKADGTTHAYSLAEIRTLLETLTGTARTAVLVAAWTGLSLGELRGLQWADIEGDQINVRRTYWRKHEGPPKTKARGEAVPLLPDVREALEAHHRENPGTTFVFEGPLQTPIDLATLGSKHVKTTLEDAGVKWHGWHALRRGLATNLHEAGVQDKIIQSLLRHSSFAVTMSYYVKPLPAENVKAMQKLDKRK
jgi:integrase